MDVAGTGSGIVSFYRQSVRVLNIATKPRQKEFEKILKVTAAGAILIGLIGVILSFILGLIK